MHKTSQNKKSLSPLYFLLVFILGVSYLLVILFPSNSFMMYLMWIWFGAFGFLKLYDIWWFARSFSQYDYIAKRLPVYWYIYPFIEIILGLFYIFDAKMVYIMPVNIIGIIISSLGIMSAYSVIRSWENISCACMGTFWKLPMTQVTILENVAMLMMILFMIFSSGSMMNM